MFTILAHSETDTEYSKSFVETKLSVEADGSYKISGAKRMIKHAAEATHFLVSCRNTGDASSEEVFQLLVFQLIEKV